MQGAPLGDAVALLDERLVVGLRDGDARLRQLDLVGRLLEERQQPLLEPRDGHALGQRAHELGLVELHERRGADVLEQ